MPLGVHILCSSHLFEYGRALWLILNNRMQWSDSMRLPRIGYLKKKNLYSFLLGLKKILLWECLDNHVRDPTALGQIKISQMWHWLSRRDFHACFVTGLDSWNFWLFQQLPRRFWHPFLMGSKVKIPWVLYWQIRDWKRTAGKLLALLSSWWDVPRCCNFTPPPGIYPKKLRN